MSKDKLDLLQGTLDLMVLQTLAAMGAQHGYGIARRIEQLSREGGAAQSRHHLRIACPPPAARLDRSRVGLVRQQPQGKVLRHHQGG